MTWETQFFILLAWGTIVALDLATFPQVLLSRPLVAATGAGVVMGEIPGAIHVGIVLELFALDVLPVGAARYPDYGPAAVAAVVLLAGRHDESASWLGLAVGYGLLGAVLGGGTLRLQRLLNTRAARRASAGLSAGNQRLIHWLQWRGVWTDLIRGMGLTALLLVGASFLGAGLPSTMDLGPVSAVAVGSGLAAALGGAVRSAGTGARPRWLLIGLGLGVALALAA